MNLTLFRLITSALLPVVLAAAFFEAGKTRRFGSLPYWASQTIIGVSFGVVAILATEFGIPVEGAVLNVRSAAPLTAGLIFGWPAGLISGVIGGVERWFSNAGDYTRLACSIGTLISGAMGAGVRRFMTDNKEASWFYGLAVGVAAEVLHMLMVFIFSSSDVYRAFTIVRICALPMISFNGLSVMTATLVVGAMNRKEKKRAREKLRLSQTFQRRLLISVLLAFGVTMLFTTHFQTIISYANTDRILQQNIRDVQSDIAEAADATLLSLTHRIAEALPPACSGAELETLRQQYDVAEIHLVDQNGVIAASSVGEYVGFPFDSGDQSAEFLCLLEGKTEFVQAYQPISYDASISRKYAGVTLACGGFLQVGFDSAHFQQEINHQVHLAARNRHIGQDGYIIICDEQGAIISGPDESVGGSISLLDGLNGRDGEQFTRYETNVQGVDVFCMFAQAEGYYIVALQPREEALFFRELAVYILAFMEVIVFAALFANIYALIQTLIVRNIRRVNASLSQITSGNLDVVVNVRSNAEFNSLSDGINSTVSTLKLYIAEAKARFDKDLEIAKQIQQSSLPSVFPPYPSRKDFAIFASMDAAREVGGDFYDFYLLDEKHLAFLIADVSGKGIPAAMFMMTAKALIKGYAESGLAVNDVFTQVNAKLCENNDAGMFVTAWMGVLDLETGLVRYANAGHNPPVVRRGDGRFEYLKGKVNLVLAGMEGVRYREQTLQLEPGDVIYLYTDGVTEAHNAQKELFGETRLLESLNEADALDVQALCRRVKADVSAFEGEAEQFDDVTMLCVRFVGHPAQTP